MFEVIGVDSSPYTAKMRAVFRYWRIPFIWRCAYPQFDADYEHLKPKLMPLVLYPGSEARTDSSAIILDLEREMASHRSVRPADPVLDLYNLIIEDMADELLTKLLFLFRFGNEVDRQFASRWVMDDTYPLLSEEQLTQKANLFLERQHSRREMVGVTGGNQAVLEMIFDRLIDALKEELARNRFLFGTRPSLADFGLFAQLYTLTSDPTPSAIIRQRAPRIEYWVRRMHDLSGVEGEWQSSSEPGIATFKLLDLAGRFYLPLLNGNADAVAQNLATYEIRVDGGSLHLSTFRYHDKCYRALRAAYAALSGNHKARADPVLMATGCLRYLA